MYCTLATLSLLALAEAAGPHNRRLDDHRRHYARMALSGESETPPLPHNLHVEVPTKRDGCTHGGWNCVGLQLQSELNDDLGFQWLAAGCLVWNDMDQGI